MSKLEIILLCVSTVSILFNIGIVLYTRNVIVKLLSVSEELGDLKTMIDNFYAHILTVYEMEMFYGDETLSHLLDHTRSLGEQLETFEYIYSLTEEDVESQEEEYDNNDNPEQT